MPWLSAVASAGGFPITTRLLTALIKAKDGTLPDPQTRNICQTDNTTPPELDHTWYPQTSPQEKDLTTKTSNDYIIQSVLCSIKKKKTQTHFVWLGNKQSPCRGSVWEISVTLTWRVQTWRRAEGFLMNDWLKRGAWEKRSTYSQNRTPFSSADRKSLLPNFFLVTAWKGKKSTQTVSEAARRVGWGEEVEGGRCEKQGGRL